MLEFFSQYLISPYTIVYKHMLNVTSERENDRLTVESRSFLKLIFILKSVSKN